MRKLLFSCLSFLFFLNANSQALNKNTLARDCDEYHLNLKKIKIKILPYHVFLDLVEVQVDTTIKIFTKYAYCKNDIIVTLPGGNLTEELAKLVMESYPKSEKEKMKIIIKDIRVLDNLIPSKERNLYLSIDFYVENEDKSYSLKHSTTVFSKINDIIEPSIGDLIKTSIVEFHTRNQFKTDAPLPPQNESSEGAYNSFPDFLHQKTSIPLDGEVIIDVKNTLDSKLILKDDLNQKITIPLVGIKYQGKRFINSYYYYNGKHFTEINHLDDEYDLIFDDYDGASSKGAIATGAIAGGLVGAAIGAAVSSAADANGLPGFIDKKTGRLITFNRSMLKAKLGANWDEYKSITKEGSREKMIAFFQRLFEEEGFKELFFKNVVFTPKTN